MGQGIDQERLVPSLGSEQGKSFWRGSNGVLLMVEDDFEQGTYLWGEWFIPGHFLGHVLMSIKTDYHCELCCVCLLVVNPL
jgi:hypothetical protein